MEPGDRNTLDESGSPNKEKSKPNIWKGIHVRICMYNQKSVRDVELSRRWGYWTCNKEERERERGVCYENDQSLSFENVYRTVEYLRELRNIL